MTIDDIGAEIGRLSVLSFYPGDPLARMELARAIHRATGGMDDLVEEVFIHFCQNWQVCPKPSDIREYALQLHGAYQAFKRAREGTTCPDCEKSGKRIVEREVNTPVGGKRTVSALDYCTCAIGVALQAIDRRG